jgi:hypothetical protein
MAQDFIVTGDSDEVMSAELQEFAVRKMWGGVSPEVQQRVSFRKTGASVVVQRRGAFWFAAAMLSDGTIGFDGPSASRIEAARKAVGMPAA